MRRISLAGATTILGVALLCGNAAAEPVGAGAPPAAARPQPAAAEPRYASRGTWELEVGALGGDTLFYGYSGPHVLGTLGWRYFVARGLALGLSLRGGAHFASGLTYPMAQALISLEYDFFVRPHVFPYLGVGLGYQYLRASVDLSWLGVVVVETHRGLAEIGAGVKFPITPHHIIGVGASVAVPVGESFGLVLSGVVRYACSF